MDKKRQQQAYENYVKQKTPVHNLPANMTKAFVTGGAICVLGQGILNICEKAGLDKDISGGWCSGISECSTDGIQCLSKDCKMGRSRSTGSDHRICQFGGSTGNRIQKRRTGYGNRL